MYDINKIRADFPILARQVYGKPLTYLDSGASAQKPQIVLDAIHQGFAEDYANVHRGLHYLSNTSTQKFEDARKIVKKFINAKSADEIIFTKNATEAINLVASSLGLATNQTPAQIGAGDEIIISVMEHHSNIVPWHFLRERHGAVLKWSPIDEQGNFLLAEFEKLFTKNTKMVAITHMSNAIGTITPMKQIIEIAHKHGARVLVDGSQSAVHLDIDVQDLDADYFVFTGHKTYGPTGVGVLYGKKDLLNAMPPFLGGGEMIDMVTQEKITYLDTPHRFEAGTPPIVEAIAMGVALQYIMDIGKPNIMAHEANLLNTATHELKKINGLEIVGEAENKGAIISFAIDGIHPHDISSIIDREGVAVRAGTHCAQPVLDFFGKSATCRASFAMYNDENDIDRLVAALKKAQSFFL
ncbi:MAG: cysteine desulfurase [Rhizobiales bacterium]|nr:cysteine desulfurase [Hyphomicrobiales bacterium]NRB12943.1 cysteine desulfurase [Hyphomicrobiales bacterium]